MRRCVRITVGRDHFDAEPLQRDHHFLAEFAAAEQEHPDGMGGERGRECRRPGVRVHGQDGVAATGNCESLVA